MPVEYKVPGVYIEEIPSGSRPIQGVGTAMPAFIGFTYTRPEGNTGQPVFVASKKDMKNMQNASPVDVEVAKLIKHIEQMSPETSGKIVNFQTGRIDPF